VEEEVRAGRMTPEQASNHPSRNVISRALGAEETVEVDLKTMEIEDGTCFLLCSDGITRHIPDTELRELLTEGADLNAICEEMKRRCYERGAEDNLTAVIVRIGDAVRMAALDDERTLIAERPAHLQTTMGGASADMSAAQLDESMHDTVEMPGKAEASAKAAAVSSAVAAPAPAAVSPASEIVVPREASYQAPPRRGAFKSLLRALMFLILLGIVGAAAFYGGMFYQKQRQADAQAAADAAKEPEPPPASPKPSAFEQSRALVDKDPKAWIEQVANTRANQDGRKPVDVDDPEFLYFYGRALFLIRDYDQSLTAFNNALAKLDQKPSTEVSPLKAEVLFGKLAAARKRQNFSEADKALAALDAISVKNDVLPTSPGIPKGR
jgi:hypothetical protein